MYIIIITYDYRSDFPNERKKEQEREVVEEERYIRRMYSYYRARCTRNQAIVVPLYYAYITFVLYTVLCSYFFNHSIIRFYFSKRIYPHRLNTLYFPQSHIRP